MARLTIAGVILATALIPAGAMSQTDSRIGAPPLPTVNVSGALPAAPMMRHMPAMPRPGVPPVVLPGVPKPGPIAGRWSQVPGGWNAYRRPSYGYTLPRYWVSAPYFISNYSLYGLPRPGAGFGWSRYYDDAVLTDRYGRVYDSRSGLDWSREARWSSEDYSDSYGYRDEPGADRARPRRKNDGFVGAVIGGVVGAVAGNLIGGAGSRLAGSLIGGGLGALAGQAIDKSSTRNRDGRGPYRGPDVTYRGGSADGGLHWDGGYAGDDRYDGGPDNHGGSHHQGGSYQHGASRSYTYHSGWGEGPSVTTVVVTHGAPIVTKKVTYVTEYVTVPARRTVKRAKYVKRCTC